VAVHAAEGQLHLTVRQGVLQQLHSIKELLPTAVDTQAQHRSG
jgi:hypothetical protein